MGINSLKYVCPEDLKTFPGGEEAAPAEGGEAAEAESAAVAEGETPAADDKCEEAAEEGSGHELASVGNYSY